MERQNPLSEKEKALFESLGRMVKNSLHSVFRTLLGKGLGSIDCDRTREFPGRFFFGPTVTNVTAR